MRRCSDRSLRLIFALTIGLSALLSAPRVIAATDESPPTQDPRALELIKKWGEALSAVPQFKFAVRDTIDEVGDSGQKLQYSHRRRAVVSRPDRLRIESEGDSRNRTIYKDGTVVTIVDGDQGVYVQAPDPGTIDDMLDLMHSKYGVGFPLADLLAKDAAATLLANVRTAEYLGQHRVGAYACHHLAFTQDTIDWQVWIDAEDRPQLQKMVITYKLEPGQPQYTVWLTQFEALDDAPDAMFAFEPPPGLKRIELRPLVDAPWDP